MITFFYVEWRYTQLVKYIYRNYPLKTDDETELISLILITLISIQNIVANKTKTW